MPVKEEDEGGKEGGATSSSSASSSNSSSSGSDSSSNSSSGSDSSSDDDSASAASSSSSQPNKKAPSTTTAAAARSERSGSNNTNNSRRSRGASVSSISSAASSAKSSSKKSNTNSISTKKATSTTSPSTSTTTATPSTHHNTSTNKRSQSATGAGVVGSSTTKGATTTTKKKQPHPHSANAAAAASSSTNKKGVGDQQSAVKGANKKPSHNPGVSSKSTSNKKNNVEEEQDKNKTANSSKSKVVKSGTVTNTRTIKPLHSSTSGTKSKAVSGKAPPATVVQKQGGTSATTHKKGDGEQPKKTKVGLVVTTGIRKKPIPTKVMPSAVHNKKESNSQKSSPPAAAVNKKSKDNKVVSSTKRNNNPAAGGVRTRASSCSSAASSSSVNSSSSGGEEEEDEDHDEHQDSSVTESSPVKQKIKRKVDKKVAAAAPNNKSSSPAAAVGRKSATKTNAKKNTVVRNLLASALLSSADDDNENDDDDDDESEGKLLSGGGGKKKKKPPHTRRPLTRRQKSSVKKTIPTTTLFNQSLLLAASTSTVQSASPTSSSPRKQVASSASIVAASSSSDLVPISSRLPSSIISRRSTSNSSANSSENESMDGLSGHPLLSSSRKNHRIPFASSLTTTSTSISTLASAANNNKNKYMSTWDSDFSDDNFSQHNITNSGANFIRVPAKTSNRPRTFDFSQSLLDPEAYEVPQCPFPSCDSSGHLSGKYPVHNFLSCCPRYHGFEGPECVENEQERSSREVERCRYRTVMSTPGKKPPKPTSETKAWLGSMKHLKETQTPDGLVSEYDGLLWKDSLAIAADRIEKEQNEGISNQGIYYRYSMAVAMGRYEMKCWCESPYPEPLSQNRRLFVCEFCLKPVGSGTVLRRHCAKCVWRHPPGDEIYRKDRLSVWEVDGKKQKTYCQNLCLLAKCFLDHKTLYLDVDPFLFYVMTLADSQGCHLVGYFSKEKNSFLNYNVSCILTLPPYMRQGFGRLLIDFSYLLTRVEGKVGSPEKPLSDLGLISYRSYWKDAVLRRLCACASREINIKDLSIELGVSTADLISTLQFLGMLKYWKGKHMVLKKQDVLEEYLERVRRRGNERQIDSSCLRWRPYQSPPDEHSSSEKS